jgi:hypothetical protein
MALQWDELEAGLEDRARQIRAQLGIDEALTRIGRPTLTGSAALRVMVAHDIDLTVAVTKLDSQSVDAVAGLGAKLATRPDVRVVTFRNDIGHWNTDPGYPDGLYLFVEPDRQPDLQHVQSLRPRIDPVTQAAILAIKRATNGRRPDGTRLPSFEIYQAVLDRGVRTPEEFAQTCR